MPTNLKHIINNCLGLLIVNCKTPLGETGYLGNSYFTGCLSILFFNLDTHVSDLRDAIPRQRSLTRTQM